MAYRSFRGGSGRLHTRLDTPPLINRRHPDSCLALNDGPDELKMTWTYLPPGLDDFFAAIGRPRQFGEPAPEPFARPADVHAIEARTGYGAPIEG
jgi:hypothetical protein